LCISDVGYHILRKREIFEKGARECIITERLRGLDRSNRRDRRNWRVRRNMMLLWLHIDILVREVVVIVFEAILLSCIGSARTSTGTCSGRSLENTKPHVKIA